MVFKLIADHCTYFYKNTYNRASSSKDYKVGKVILAPLRLIKTVLRNLGLVK